MTTPFQVVNNEPKVVRDKFLEGNPNINNFPGPFQPSSQMQSQMQPTAAKNWSKSAVEPLQNQAKRYPTYNSGDAQCDTYGASSPIMYNRNENFVGDVSDFHDPSITNPCNQTGFGVIVPKFSEMPEGIPAWTPNSGENSGFTKCSQENNFLTDIEHRPVEQFSHNNMVPYYGSKLTQNMSSTEVPQAGDNNTCKGLTNGTSDVTPWRDKLQTFTGTDEMYLHKRETPTMFSPAEQQTGWVFGTPAFRPDLDRYKESLHVRNMEAPVEKIRVGRGLGMDPTVPATGGFQQFLRILPNNVNDYKANQLEGRVTGGKWGINHPTSQYIHGVNKDKPDLTITQARRPTMRTKFYNNAPDGGDARITDYNTAINKGRQTREDTEASGGFGELKEMSFNEYFTNSGDQPRKQCISFGIAPVGKIMGSAVPMPTQDLQSYTNIRETFKRGSTEYNEKTGTFTECLDSSQGANKWGIIMGPASGGVSEGIPRANIYVNFTDRGDVNPYVINVGAQTGSVWNPNSFQDQQKVTTKETTMFSNTGNLTGTSKSYINSWSDAPKVTTQETTQFAYQGNPSDKQNYINTWSDNPKVTRKETTDFSHSGNLNSMIATSMDRSMYVGSTFFPVK